MSGIKAFELRTDLRQYGDNALLLFALEMKWGIDDVRSVASTCLTDGNDDKKCDLVYVDRDAGVAVIAQGYFSKKKRQSAPANKASDLNTAISWLLSQDERQLSDRIRPAAIELRDAILTRAIDTIEIWYVHNAPESVNVRRELATVEQSAKTAVAHRYHDGGITNIRAIEVGLQTIEEWYKSTSAPILVSDEFTLDTVGGYELQSEQWKAYCTAIPAKWLYNLYHDKKTDLFSVNVRDYLGSRKSDSNINHGIKKSAVEHPDKFWAFNNGITALVNDFSVEKIDDGVESLTISGISIVNGAQTTGAIGSLISEPDEKAMVPARFIRCSNVDIVHDIVRYNNSQNKVEPADFRSTDSIQDRLRKEFSALKESITYLGGRRGGVQDAMRRLANHLSSDTVAQSLAAFHQHPGLAYNRKSEIWKSDTHYSRIFNENTHADHIIFVYSLHLNIMNLKLELMAKDKQGDLLTQDDQAVLEFLRYRGSIYALMAAIGKCMETILGRPISDHFLLRYSGKNSLSQSEKLWTPIVQCCIPFSGSLKKPLENGLENSADTDAALDDFRRFVSATRATNRAIYDAFAAAVSCGPR